VLGGGHRVADLGGILDPLHVLLVEIDSGVRATAGAGVAARIEASAPSTCM
jgi:hypothetical protein